MFYLTNGQTNTMTLWLSEVVSTCTLRYTDLGTQTTSTASLTIGTQNERYVDVQWDVSTNQGQYLLEFMVNDEVLATHTAYVTATADDPLEYHDYVFHE